LTVADKFSIITALNVTLEPEVANDVVKLRKN